MSGFNDYAETCLHQKLEALKQTLLKNEWPIAMIEMGSYNGQ